VLKPEGPVQLSSIDGCPDVRGPCYDWPSQRLTPDGRRAVAAARRAAGGGAGGPVLAGAAFEVTATAQRVAASATAAVVAAVPLLSPPPAAAPVAPGIMHDLEEGDDLCFLLAGGPNHECLVLLWGYLDTDQAFSTMRMRSGSGDNTADYDAKSKPGPKPSLSPFEQMVFFLVAFHRLRGGGRIAIAAHMFGVTVPVARGYYNVWAPALSLFFQWQQPPATMAQAREQCPPRTTRRLNLPVGAALFLGGCTERWVDAPHDAALNSALFSQYKKHCTLKYLVISIGNSYIDYVSPGYCGGATDNGVFLDAGIASFLACRQ